MIPQELNMTIDRALEMNPELKKAYEEQEDIRRLIDTAKASGRAAPPYVHARGGRGDQPEEPWTNTFPCPAPRTVPSPHSLP